MSFTIYTNVYDTVQKQWNKLWAKSMTSSNNVVVVVIIAVVDPELGEVSVLLISGISGNTNLRITMVV